MLEQEKKFTREHDNCFKKEKGKGLIINKNTYSILDNRMDTLYFDRLGEIFKDIANIAYIPNKFHSFSFFNLIIKDIIKMHKHTDTFEEYIQGSKTLQTQKLNNFFSQLKAAFSNPVNEQTLIKLGLDPNGFGIALITENFNVLEKLCNENTESDIYKIGHNVMFMKIAEIFWRPSEENGFKTFADVQNITLNAVQRTKIDNEITIDSNRVTLKDLHDIESIYHSELALDKQKTSVAIFSHDSAGVWNPQELQMAFDAMKDKSVSIKSYGSGDHDIDISKIHFILKDINKDNQSTDLIIIIRQHGKANYTPEFHDQIFNLPTKIADNMLYNFQKCFSGIDISLINYNGKEDTIPLGKNLLYVSQSEIESRALIADHVTPTTFDKFFNNRELTIKNYATYFSGLVTGSTPHVTGYYNEIAVPYQPLSKFVEDLFNPSSYYNQNMCPSHNNTVTPESIEM